MKVCPRCHKEVNEEDRFCPHCGLSLTSKPVKQRKIVIPMYLVVALIFFVLPFINSYILNSGFLQQSTNPVVADTYTILEIKEDEASQVLYSFDNIDDYNKTITNASTFIEPVNEYIDSLSIHYDVEFETDYLIVVLSNNDVVIKTTSVAKLQDNLSLEIVRGFNRSKTVDDITTKMIKTQCKDYESLSIENQTDLISTIMGTKKTQDLLATFNDRAQDFENKKKHIGHYGYGIYKDDYSYVIYKDGDGLFKGEYSLKQQGKYELVR